MQWGQCNITIWLTCTTKNTTINRPVMQKMEKGRSAYKLPPPRRKFYQYQIGRSGSLAPLETRQLLTKINMIGVSKIGTSQNRIYHEWKDVFDIKWMCCGCKVATLKHAPFCYNLRSYSKHELDIKNNCSCFLSHDLVILATHELEVKRKMTRQINCHWKNWKTTLKNCKFVTVTACLQFPAINKLQWKMNIMKKIGM